MLKPPARRRRIPGQIVEIALGQGKKSYARVLKEPLFAFYDKIFDASDNPNTENVVQLPIAFKINVMNSSVTSGRWHIIGRIDLTPDLEKVPSFCKQDIVTGELFIYQEVPELAPDYERPATAEECKGLEAAAVWDAEHVEDRLRDHFAGQPNEWVEQLRPRF
ncbi:Imm26 family immunity protein [Pelagerythrobacter rhizovicinus]|uniref:Imm26 family immunity protein n=1 Tax=Pelagerythrobacter rhizovicinus TaxID=2268576 RepID=UPI0013EA88F0|nr:Imm26 family immunity protein [Pelagerythrobacter rhizovicinus]